MNLIEQIGQDQQTAKQDETITLEAQRFYDSANRADRRGEPVTALLHRNIGYITQHGTFNAAEYRRWLDTQKQKEVKGVNQ